MQGNCPNPGCNATYALTAQHVGRQFACRDCGVMLRVEQDGLYIDAASAAAPVRPAVQASPTVSSASTSPASRQTSPTRSLGTQQLLPRVKSLAFDGLFGLGAILVIVFAFFPVLDHLHGMRYRADITAAQTEFTRADRDLTAKVTDDGRKARDKKLEGLRDAAEDQDQGAKYAAWWYGWGTLIGFLLLAVASVAWMGANQSRTHRVVASIVLCTELLLVFIVYVFGQMGPRL